MARGIPASCHKDVARMAGQVNFDTDTDMFTYFTEQGWLPRLHKTLSGGATAQAPGLLEDYPWEDIAEECFLDVGGGGGGLVALLLRKHKMMRAAIFDTTKVIEHATENFHSPTGEYANVGDRVPRSNLIIGDFHVEVPSFEVYTMKWCLHDWDDSKALTVMGNIRKSIIRGPKSRLIILESLLKEGRMGRLARYGDLTMAISANGQERDEGQWRALARETSWEVTNIYHLRNAWVCAIELVPIWDDVRPETNGTAEMKNVAKHDFVEEMNGGQKLVNEPFSKRREVSTAMSFLEPWAISRGQPFFRSVPDPGFESKNFDWVDHPVTVTNSRGHKNNFTLDKNGFCYVDDSNTMTPELLDALRVGVKKIVQELYYPQVERLVKRVTGASRVLIFDHTVRKKDPSLKKEDNPNGKEQPATVVS